MQWGKQIPKKEVYKCLEYYFFGVPHLATYIFFLFPLNNEPGLGPGINPGMALTPFPSGIG